MGAISPIGKNTYDLWENAKKGVCGIDYIKGYDTSDKKVKIAAEIKDYNETDYFDRKEAKKYDKFTQLAVIAAREAFKNSGLKKEDIDENTSTIISAGIGGFNTIIDEHNKANKRGFDRVSPFFIPMAISNMAAGAVAIDLGLHGICNCVVTACASGTSAIGDAFRNIRDGYTNLVFAGGSESTINPLAVGGFTSMKALNESNDISRASIPFDKERSGFVMGEGAGILVLEEYEHALKRKANILGEIVGYAATCDAYHMTSPLESGHYQAKCMIDAVKDAGISRDEIDYINAHGTSTPMNDKGETKAIKLAFKEHAKKLLVSSSKSMLGHLLGASGAVEAIITINSLKDGVVTPTINYKVKDEECDLDIVPNEKREVLINYAISNSFGFGGHNASLVFKRFQE